MRHNIEPSKDYSEIEALEREMEPSRSISIGTTLSPLRLGTLDEPPTASDSREKTYRKL
jgi:hypothetical protein